MSKHLAHHHPEWYRIKEVEPGAFAVEVRTDKLPIPPDSFFADWFDFELIGRTVTFRFGKMAAFKRQIRAVLEVAVSLAQIRHMAQSLAGDFRQTLDRFMEKEGARVEQPTIDQVDDPKAHSVVASFTSVAFSDSDAEITFYRFPPTEGAKLLRSKGNIENLTIIPVVRIDTTTSVLLRFAEALQDLLGKAEELGVKSS